MATPRKANPKKQGRKKFVFTKKRLDQVRQWAAIGMHKQMMAAGLGIGKTRFYEELDQNPALSNAIDEGRAEGFAGAAMLIHKDIHENENVNSARWLLEKRFGWNGESDDDEDEAQDKIININVSVRDD